MGVFIGRIAGYNHAHTRCVVINGSGNTVDTNGNDRTYITGMRGAQGSYWVHHTPGSAELTSSSGSPSSDDRLKFNEKFISNATDTLVKLRPQIYEKQQWLVPETEDQRRRVEESGLIAQEIFYDVPELRHIVEVPPTARDLLEHVTSSADPAIDPNYANWGDDPARVDYVQLIPYVIQSIKEIAANREKVPLSATSHDGLIVSSDDTGNHLSSTVGDPACIGVASGDDGDVVTSGTARVWVLNSSGNLSVGDLVTTSSVAGYAQKQGDTQVTSATFAKVLRSCDFAPGQVPVKRARRNVVDVTMYVKTWRETCGEDEYNSYPDENREIVQYRRYITEGLLKSQEEYDAMTEEAKAVCRPEDVTEYYRIMRSEVSYATEGYEAVTKQVNVEERDAHGNIVYEDTDETEPEYPIRTLDGGVVAALVKCKLF